jgi:phosphohistidine phosphatase
MASCEVVHGERSVKVVLVRHADAGHADPVRHPDDRLRPLVDAGVREHADVARALARLDLGVTHVLSSPFLRARQTAEITARAIGWPGTPETVETLGDRFSVEALLGDLARLPRDAVVMCFGHEPHLSRFAASLLHPDGTARITLAKSGVIAVECHGAPAAGAGRLLLMLQPRELRRLMAQDGQ